MTTGHPPSDHPRIDQELRMSATIESELDPDGASGPADQSGGMFWLSRKTFVRSYVRLSALSRWYLASP